MTAIIFITPDVGTSFLGQCTWFLHLFAMNHGTYITKQGSKDIPFLVPSPSSSSPSQADSETPH